MTSIIDLIELGFFSGLGNAIAYYLITEHLLQKMKLLNNPDGNYSNRLKGSSWKMWLRKRLV